MAKSISVLNNSWNATDEQSLLGLYHHTPRVSNIWPQVRSSPLCCMIWPVSHWTGPSLVHCMRGMGFKLCPGVTPCAARSTGSSLHAPGWASPVPVPGGVCTLNLGASACCTQHMDWTWCCGHFIGCWSWSGLQTGSGTLIRPMQPNEFDTPAAYHSEHKTALWRWRQTKVTWQVLTGCN